MTRLIPACCVGACFALGGNALMADTVAEASGDLIEYSIGHADVGLAFEEGELELHYHFGDPDTLNPPQTEEEFNPSAAYVRVGDDAMSTATGDIPFLGVSNGDPIWVLPQANNPLLPFLGIAAEELSGSEFNSASLSMTAFSGPGQFALWQADGINPPDVFMQTNDGVDPSQDTLDLTIGAHDHYNWGFTAEGVYDVTLLGTAGFIAGGSVNDTETFKFVVGSSTAVPEPSSFATLATLGVVGWGVSRRRRKPQTSDTTT